MSMSLMTDGGVLAAQNEQPAPPQERERKPLHAICLECGHVWIALYAPMEMAKASRVVRHLHCPMCGTDARRIGVKSQ